jgi:hypothetical protein
VIPANPWERQSSAGVNLLALAAEGSAVIGDFLPLFHGFHEKTLSHSKLHAAGLQNEGLRPLRLPSNPLKISRLNN